MTQYYVPDDSRAVKFMGDAQCRTSGISSDWLKDVTLSSFYTWQYPNSSKQYFNHWSNQDQETSHLATC